MKVCPACHGVNVRRSHLRPSETKLHLLFSPYRCKACGLRFWVISKRARMYGAFASGICVATAIGAIAFWNMPHVAAPAGLSAPSEKATAFGSIPRGPVIPEAAPADRHATR